MTPPDGAAPEAYAKTDRSRIRRNNARARYDREAVHGVLDAGLMCHVAYVFDGQPYVTSTAYWRSGACVYWHGSSASRMIRRVGGGLPVCFSVALLDGVVLARSGFHHSFNYRSVVAYGTAEEIEDTDEKLRALEVFTERLVPGRWAELRAPTEQELKATAVMRMELREVAAKVRQGPPSDDAEDMDAPVWAGVLPTHRAFGEPEPDPAMRQGIREPDYLKHIRFD
jgi:nitroimidazol reductase NimA-like FMN-containing flavoprotein (pyridoxamine 5'-phosphate oxidase superfamily)